MTYDGKHTRWTQVHGFPQNKYNFTQHLQNVGNYVVTMPMSWKDYKKFKDAAYQWAWKRGWVVQVTCKQVGEDLREVTCKLVSKVKKRDYG